VVAGGDAIQRLAAFVERIEQPHAQNDQHDGGDQACPGTLLAIIVIRRLGHGASNLLVVFPDLGVL
jgi:hypothetical protein